MNSLFYPNILQITTIMAIFLKLSKQTYSKGKIDSVDGIVNDTPFIRAHVILSAGHLVDRFSLCMDQMKCFLYYNRLCIPYSGNVWQRECLMNLEIRL